MTYAGKDAKPMAMYCFFFALFAPLCEMAVILPEPYG